MMRAFSKAMVWTFCLSLIFALSVSATVVDDVLLMPMAEEAPEIDAELDGVWHSVTNTHMLIWVDEVLPENGWLDLSGSYRAMWDESGFYFFGSVLDDEIDNTGANNYECDSWEIYFDAQNLKNDGSYVDGNDKQWRYVYNMTDYNPGWVDPGTCAWIETDNGYDFELFIPADSLLFPMEADHEIGWDAQINERDGGTRQTMLKWWDPTNDSWFNPAGWGEAMLTDRGVSEVLDIQMATSAPEIDGEMDAVWEDVPEVSMNTYVDQDLTLMSGWNDLQFSYRCMWDAAGFYFFGQVIDDEIDNTGSNNYECDSWEVYFDAQNLKNDGSYVAGNDKQWRYVYNMTDYNPGWVDPGTCAWLETDDGYDFELFIPADSLLFPMEADHEIGWDCQVNDRDNASRETMGKWWDPTNDSWFNPAGWGTAVLVGDDAVESDRMPARYSFVDNYPNPFNPQTTIEYQLSKPAKATLSVYNLVGEKVATMVNNASETQFKFDAGAHNLTSGVYIYRVVAGNEVLTNKMMLLK
jgi:hypothetical protein